MRRGETMLHRLTGICLSVLEQPKNALKGDWRGQGVDKAEMKLLEEWNEVCIEAEIRRAGDISGTIGLMRELPDLIICAAMLYEELENELIKAVAEEEKKYSQSA